MNDRPLPWEAPESAATPPKTTPEAAQKRGRTPTPVASEGKRVNAADTPPKPLRFPAEPTTYIPQEDIDYTDISQLNKDINRVRSALFHSTRELSRAEAREAQAKHLYKSNLNREIIKLSGGSERQRVAIAEIAVEDYYSDFLVAERVRVACENNLRAVRADLSALESLGHNLRAQMQVM